MSELTRVKLTDEAWKERAIALADAVRQRALLVEDGKDERETYQKTLKAMDREIKRLAEVVRTGVEDHEPQLGMFP